MGNITRVIGYIRNLTVFPVVKIS